ncbi:hypothetical protein EOA24_00500 [Mesorhizobium sp. M2A.F.Ca.ET.039.01.1.1]|nr:hypothetical protein [Mesorhizobium sp. M2A.F.Ca.ET.039.01.1.1]RWX72506.1 hypothetical protein EOA24_00500 [Mesorhizobium sp. M2A.F.Ca.ET.039.01.1.1]
MSRARASILPPTLPPRGLSRDEAAAYLGIGTTLFDRLVEEKKLPGPKSLGGRLVWDRLAVDVAFEAIPTDGAAPADPWGNVRA